VNLKDGLEAQLVGCGVELDMVIRKGRRGRK
jgi:hypothetical protein